MPLIVTGTGRSGTTYVAELLRAAGVRCGHEDVFHPFGEPEWGDLEADASFLAVPYLPAGAPTVLVLRHPLAVVKSFVDFRFFADCDDPYQRFVAHFAPMAWWGEHTEPDRALAYWCTWNLRASMHADLIVRLEQLHEPELAAILERGGLPTGLAAHAIATVPRKTNPKTDEKTRDWPADWSAFSPHLARTGQWLARLWGYDP